ncbi:CSC1-like protein RXW8 [Aristolochia californica]|uniref:CSC1-like protein RXW8 n=1 Tax=Aristolochia californica TaxID=171875 RepID=UPI0035DBDAB4
MNISALLTSAGINIGLCAVLLCLYSVLRKQPGNAAVYFGRRLAQMHMPNIDTCNLERFVPSASWILKAWESSEAEILSIAGLDAVVFLRLLVFSIRIFSIAAVVCIFAVLPLNYYGQEMVHVVIPSESLDVFTIENVNEESRWLWVHCLALYIISFSACILLYFEYKSIAKMRLAHITQSPPNLSHFSVLVRSVPATTDRSFSESVKCFFTNYHASSYLSHLMVYRTGKVQKLLNDVEKFYKSLVNMKTDPWDQKCRPSRIRCGVCGGSSSSFVYSNELQEIRNPSFDLPESIIREKECPAAFVFFKTRYAAIVAAQVLQSPNPMLWVTELAPEPHDVKWSNLCIPYRQLWIRRIATLLAAIVFMLLFLIPVTFVQGLSQLEQLQQMFPFLKRILKKKLMNQLVTGYLPSVILLLFLYSVPPTMMLFSAVEGCISRSGRKMSACCKVLYFTIWNVFFVNVLSGSVISQLNVISSPKDIPTQLAKAVPRQATFFTTYVLASGWTSLASEIMQPFALICSLFNRFILRSKDDPNLIPAFPYHTEIPKVLLFGLLGFTCSILAPLILPFLLVYFLLAYIVYRNQILNVYISKYESGGQVWPVVHNTTVFSLALTQVIALGVFSIKKSPIASGFTIPLLILTLLFNEYCRQRFHPIFKSISAQDLIEMDRDDEEQGRMEEIHVQLMSAYTQFPADSRELCLGQGGKSEDGSSTQSTESRGLLHFVLGGLSITRIQRVFTWLSMVITLQERGALR